ncbi:CesT family type III secretion system chaperone [Pigmentiphaga sp.]|uniref:CesT family type III secretion system chaperone n=1 Tax=Pigmentiphaga sp. TaxID=1977564 RepID=UPI00128D3F82|nr:CesT family type III secretion system chaperone [Pigmentiphaga sp.]MPS30696.1 molecular chaperone Tir [Alcaligenaceae bacterium SAGV5]MPS50628.1 molecular chaperone Tir [Alcaligenaceae bacterium SAGV3]MPT55612.1 molecular chaperone Tir [Alcaligenaceae bacterium]
MSRNRFIDLVNEFCALARLDQPAQLAEGHAVEVDGVDFIFQYDEEYAPEHVMLYCDFGVPPEERLLDVYEALLETNMIVYGASSPAFMLGPDKRVTFGYQCRLADVRANQLIGILQKLAGQAKDWRTDHFLEASLA